MSLKKTATGAKLDLKNQIAPKVTGLMSYSSPKNRIISIVTRTRIKLQKRLRPGRPSFRSLFHQKKIDRFCV